MSNDFQLISSIIKNRRTIKPFMMNGGKIPDEQIIQLLELADWAPTHGFTEPWRFVVYRQPSDFCYAHAKLYKQNTDLEAYNESGYNNLRQQGDKASHVLVAIVHRGNLPKISAFEEVAAAACAVQNLLLGATALKIASYWGTGGMILKPAMKQFLDLRYEDEIMGVLYLGYNDEQAKGFRKIPLAEKVKWI